MYLESYNQRRRFRNLLLGETSAVSVELRVTDSYQILMHFWVIIALEVM